MARGVFLVVLLVGLVAFLAELSSADGDRAFALGTLPGGVIAVLERGDSVCQRNIDVPPTGAFQGLEVAIDAPGSLSVRVLESGTVVASGAAQGSVVELDRAVRGDATVSVCVENVRAAPVGLVGSGMGASPRTFASFGGERLQNDLDLTFFCGCERSRLENLPNEIRNAAFFKIEGAPTSVGAVVAALLLIGVPILAWWSLGIRGRE